MCGGPPLRPVSRQELDADLLDDRYRHIALQAAQGSKDWEPPVEILENWVNSEKGPVEPALLSEIYRSDSAAGRNLRERYPPGSWLLRCDRCGMRLLWSPPQEIFLPEGWAPGPDNE